MKGSVNESYAKFLKLGMFFFFIVIIINSVNADSVLNYNLQDYNQSYLILDDFQQNNGWGDCSNCIFSINNKIIAYENSANFSTNNTGQINRTLNNINFSRFQVMKIWVKVENNSDADGYNIRIFDDTGKNANWNINSNTNVLRRNILEINGSGYGTPPAGLSAGFNWNNVTMIQIRESSLATFPGTILIDDLRLSNDVGDFNGSWIIPTEVDGRRGDWSIVNFSNNELKAVGITYQNASLLSQVAFLYSNLTELPLLRNYELSFTARDYANDTDNFHTLWSINRLNWYGHHDTIDGYITFSRNNLTGGASDNTLAIKRRYNSTIGSPIDIDLLNPSSNYLNPRNYTIRFINNNIKVFINGQLNASAFDPNTSLLSSGLIGFRIPDNEIISSWANMIITNFSQINYNLNETRSSITNSSGDIIDLDSGLSISGTSTSKTITSQLSQSVNASVIVNVGSCSFTANYNGNGVNEDSCSDNIATFTLTNIPAGASQLTLSYLDINCSSNTGASIIIILVFSALAIVALTFIIVLKFKEGELDVKLLIIVFIAIIVGLVLFTQVAQLTGGVCN